MTRGDLVTSIIMSAVLWLMSVLLMYNLFNTWMGLVGSIISILLSLGLAALIVYLFMMGGQRSQV